MHATRAKIMELALLDVPLEKKITTKKLQKKL